MNREEAMAYYRERRKAKARSPRIKDTFARKYKKQKINSRKKVRDLRAEMKNNPCTDCGEILDPYLMSFDHVRGEKRRNVAEVKTVTQLLIETAKCELVCRFCHDVREYLRGTSGFEKLGRLRSLARLLEVTNVLG